MKMGIYQKVSVLAVSAVVFSGVSNLSAQDSPQATNILANPGFEEGVKGWNDRNSGECDDKVFHQGNYSGLIKRKGEKGKDVHISQTVPLPVAGSKVDGSAWVKTSTPDVEYRVYCDIATQKTDGTKEWFATEGIDWQKNPDDEWKEVKFSFTFPSDPTDKDGNITKKICSFYFRLLTNDKCAGDIWFDDASLVVTPPPSGATTQPKSGNTAK